MFSPETALCSHTQQTAAKRSEMLKIQMFEQEVEPAISSRNSDAFAALLGRHVPYVQLLLFFPLERVYPSIRRLLRRVDCIRLIFTAIVPLNQSFSFRLRSGVSPAVIIGEVCPKGEKKIDFLHI